MDCERVLPHWASNVSITFFNSSSGGGCKASVIEGKKLSNRWLSCLRNGFNCSLGWNDTPSKSRFELPCWGVEVDVESQMGFPSALDSLHTHSQHHTTSCKHHKSVLAFCFSKRDHALPFCIALVSHIDIGKDGFHKRNKFSLIGLGVNQLIRRNAVRHKETV